MKRISINLAGKLPSGLMELYREVSDTAKYLNIDLLIVGAMARDLVLVHGYGSRIERGTRDVDFGVNVASWEDFDRLKTALSASGFEVNPGQPHKLIRRDVKGLPWEIDIVPFGKIAREEYQISWPPDHAIIMSVLGFSGETELGRT